MILNFQTSVTQLATCDTHLCYSGFFLMVTQRSGKWSVYWENWLWHPLVRSQWMGQWVQWALLYWSKDDKILKVGAHWDFLDAPQSAKTTRFYNILKRNCFSLVSTMTVEEKEERNKVYIFTTHNSNISNQEEDTACHPPIMSIQFCPTATVKILYN